MDQVKNKAKQNKPWNGATVRVNRDKSYPQQPCGFFGIDSGIRKTNSVPSIEVESDAVSLAFIVSLAPSNVLETQTNDGHL